MLEIELKGRVSDDYFDEKTGEFVTINEKSYNLKLEHSLLSLDRWESKWKKPFLTEDPKTVEEALDYIKCMTINKDIPDEAYNRLTEEQMNEINEYIHDPMTATTIRKDNKPGGRRIITSELLYHWMIALNIPMEFEKRHLNKLIMLIQVIEAENNPKKMSRSDMIARREKLNNARKAKYNTKG